MPVLSFRVETRAEDGERRPAPEALAANGPLIPVVLTPTEEFQLAPAERKENVSAPVSGFAMIDTGATRTCFDEAAARRAGFPIIDTAMMTSATHANHKVPVFAGRIVMGPITIDVSRGLGANLATFDGLVALIGRDLLQQVLFTYDGPGGSIAFAL